jgi:hypothetical protein
LQEGEGVAGCATEDEAARGIWNHGDIAIHPIQKETDKKQKLKVS